MSGNKVIVASTPGVLRDDTARDAAEDLGESLIKAVCSENVAVRIPVVKALIDGVLVFHTIKDAILERKLLKFVTGLSDLSSWEIEDTVSRLQADASYRRRVGEHLVELIDRIDSHRKPRMVAAVFAAYAKRQIEVSTFNRLMAAVEALPSYEISTVRKFCDASGEERVQIATESLQALVGAGLATPLSGFGGLVYEPNATCKAFVDLDLDRKSLED